MRKKKNKEHRSDLSIFPHLLPPLSVAYFSSQSRSDFLFRSTPLVAPTTLFSSTAHLICARSASSALQHDPIPLFSVGTPLSCALLPFLPHLAIWASQICSTFWAQLVAEVVFSHGAHRPTLPRLCHSCCSLLPHRTFPSPVTCVLQSDSSFGHYQRMSLLSYSLHQISFLGAISQPGAPDLDLLPDLFFPWSRLRSCIRSPTPLLPLPRFLQQHGLVRQPCLCLLWADADRSAAYSLPLQDPLWRSATLSSVAFSRACHCFFFFDITPTSLFRSLLYTSFFSGTHYQRLPLQCPSLCPSAISFAAAAMSALSFVASRQICSLLPSRTALLSA